MLVLHYYLCYLLNLCLELIRQINGFYLIELYQMFLKRILNLLFALLSFYNIYLLKAVNYYQKSTQDNKFSRDMKIILLILKKVEVHSLWSLGPFPPG